MAELKTRKTTASVDGFLERVDASRRDDCMTLVRLMSQATGSKPRMWGGSIVGFGDYNYKYESGREGEWFVMGFSPRKKDLTLYLMAGLDNLSGHLDRLGRHTVGRSCLYIKRLSDVDRVVLEDLVKDAAKIVQDRAKA